MAGSQPILRALFGVSGVAEVILEPRQVRVRVGRLFSWAEVEDDVRKALKRATRGVQKPDRDLRTATAV